MREQNRDADFVDPLADIDTINLELILADLDSINKALYCVAKMAKAKDKEAVEELAVLDKIKPVLKKVYLLVRLNLRQKKRKLLNLFSY